MICWFNKQILEIITRRHKAVFGVAHSSNSLFVQSLALLLAQILGAHLQFRRAPRAALHIRQFSTTVSEQQHTLCSSPSLAIVWFSVHWFTWLYFLHRIQCVLTSERDVGLAGRSISGWRNEDELNEDELNICRVEWMCKWSNWVCFGWIEWMHLWWPNQMCKCCNHRMCKS